MWLSSGQLNNDVDERLMYGLAIPDDLVSLIQQHDGESHVQFWKSCERNNFFGYNLLQDYTNLYYTSHSFQLMTVLVAIQQLVKIGMSRKSKTKKLS